MMISTTPSRSRVQPANAIDAITKLRVRALMGSAA
jgi:hypothetical protein